MPLSVALLESPVHILLTQFGYFYLEVGINFSKRYSTLHGFPYG